MSSQPPQSFTCWVRNADGTMGAPLPFLPPDIDDAVISIQPDGSVLVDKSATASSGMTPMTTSASLSPLDIPDPGSGDGNPATPQVIVPDLRRNSEKFQNQSFQLVDTNDAVWTDETLYNACAAIPDNGNPNPNIQISMYGTNALIIRASHFDYSDETRDLALLITDDVAKPIWKTVDFSGASDAQDGWLVQGLVPNWQVMDTMFFVISNIDFTCNAFFTVIPYSGPEITLTGADSNSVVNGTITLTAHVRDLSGTTNEAFELTVDGDPARYTLTNNSIIIDTRYNPNGICGVWLNAASAATVYNITNAPADTKLVFGGSGVLPLDFENPTYLTWSGDNCSPEVGSIYITFTIDRPRDVDIYIYAPSDNHVMAHYGGSVPYAANVQIPYDFTDWDGSPYTNDTYVVYFSATGGSSGASVPALRDSGSDDFYITNNISRDGVRTAGGNILTYEEENPSLGGAPNPSYLNSEASRWVDSLALSYENLYVYDYWTMTDFYPSQIGDNRDNPAYVFPLVLTHAGQEAWSNNVHSTLTNLNYSDFTWYMGHANGFSLGGGPSGSTWVESFIDTSTVGSWIIWPKRNWRMRKVALWGCYTFSPLNYGQGGIRYWYQAFGINDVAKQTTSLMRKNTGLFFAGALPQGGFSGTMGGGTSVEVACDLDIFWMEGPYPYPGMCDPTYAFSWAYSEIRGMSPQLDKSQPMGFGFGYLPYTGVYDDELMTNNISHVKLRY